MPLVKLHVFFFYSQNRAKVNNFYKLKRYCSNISKIFIKNNYKFNFNKVNVIELLDKIKDFCIWKKSFINDDNFHYNELNINKIMYFLIKLNFLDEVYKYILDDITKDDNYDDCPICMEPITVETGCKLKCNHIYHKECIIKCFKTPNYVNQFQEMNICLECPYCRYNILEFKT